MDDVEQYSIPGSYPEFGAIFMSNHATKKECIRRKVFGLPNSMWHFVKQVKAGMILFLFEFEKRELHGVFQACSDGAMNILPHAFSSSRKQFPAQVKFTPMWHCQPLSEAEFRDAIRENYFSKTKFKFGLSEDQVRRLLSLFSLKRLKDQAPKQQLTRSKVARRSGYSSSKTRRLVDNDRSPRSNQLPVECHVDSSHGPVISNMPPDDSFYNDEGATVDGRFSTYTDARYDHKASAFVDECFRDLMGKFGGNIDAGEYARSDRVETEWNTGIELQPTASVGYSSGNFRSISNDVRFAKIDMLETKLYEDDGFAPNISTAYRSPFQSNVNPQAYSRKHVLETGSFIDDPTRLSSDFLPSMEPQNSNVSHPKAFEDSIVTTTLPYDPDVSDISYRASSSLGFNQDHTSLQEYTSHDSFGGNVLGSSTIQPFPSLPETRRTTITPDINSASGDFIPLPYSNQYERSSRTSQPRHDYFDDLAANYSTMEGCGDPSLLKPSLAPAHSEIRNYVRISGQPSSYSTSPSKLPSLNFSERYHTLLQDKHDCQVPERKNDAEFYDDGFMFKAFQHHGDSFCNDNRAIEDGRFAMYKDVEREYKGKQQEEMPVPEPTNVAYHEVTSYAYQNSECVYPDCQKKRASVFSRLALPPRACEQESNTRTDTAYSNRNALVNEVMDMLHRSHYDWVKTRCKDHDNAANSKDKKGATRKDSSTISKDMNVKPISLSKEKSCQKTEEATFVDFKRRSAVRKNLEDGKTGNDYESPNDKSASTVQCKRRKLIRPKFCENESSGRNISVDAPEIVSGSSTECFVHENADSIKVFPCYAYENDISPNVKLPNKMCQSAVEGNKNDKGSGSNPEQVSMESYIAFRGADEGGKESSENHAISSMTSASSGQKLNEIEQDLTTRDMWMGGSSQDRNDMRHLSRESSPKICEDNDGNGVAKSQFFHNIEQIHDLCSVGGETRDIHQQCEPRESII